LDRRLAHALVVAGLLIASPPLSGQQSTPPSVPHPDTDYAEPEPPPQPLAATAFVMPDVPDDWNHYTTFDGTALSMRFMTVGIVDYNSFTQDDDSRRQVGEQINQWDLRTWRLMFSGRMKFGHPVDYFISFEVKGQDHVQTGTSKVGFTDFDISTELGVLGKLHVGKVKEPFVYEMIGDAANLQQQERALSPFFASRGIGLRLARQFANDSMTYSIGWFNDWWVADQTFKSSGNDFAARLTGVPYWTQEGSNYVHVAIAFRHVGADDGKLQFKGRPESNVSNYYVDSGSLVGNHATELNLEGIWDRGPFFLTGDVTRAWVDSSASGNPQFWGGYVAVSYVLTGEHRPYDKNVAYARRIMPRRKWGAWEIVGRYSHVDVADQAIDGGIFDRETIGLNWWATRRWKLGFDYGYIDLNRVGTRGTTNAFHTRFQWIY